MLYSLAEMPLRYQQQHLLVWKMNGLLRVGLKNLSIVYFRLLGIYFSVQFWNALNGDGGSTYLDSKIVDFNDSFTHLKLHEMQEDEYDYKNGWFFFEICRDKYNWVTLYINQKYKYRAKASEKAYFAQNSSLILGNWVNDGWHYHGGWFNGYLYDIKLYNYALYPGPASIINTKINMY